MKKSLLMTTALVAIYAANNAYADDLIVDTNDVTITEDAEYLNVKVKSGKTLTINGAEVDANEIEINNGNLVLQNAIIESGSEGQDYGLDIKDSTITMTDSDMRAHGVSIDNSTVTLNGGIDFTADHSDFEFKSGTISMNGGREVIGANQSSNPEHTQGDFVMTDGTLNVSGGSAHIDGPLKFNEFTSNYIQGINAEISGGEVNVAEGAYLERLGNGTFEGEGDDELLSFEKGGINLTDTGVINLSGTLYANVLSNDGKGTININSANAKVDGDVEGINAVFATDHSLSKAISGTIGDIASLNVNSGTLTYDKQTGKISELNVVGGLDIGTNTVNATTVDFKDNSKLALRVASTDSFGKINATTINVGNDTTMNVTLDNGVVGNGKNAKFKFLNGTVNGDFINKIAENSRYAIEWADDGSLSITGQASASDIVADAGGTANNAKTAEAWDTITSSSTASAEAKAVASTLGDLSQNATTAAGKKAYINALTAVAPEVAPAVQQTSVETANQVFGAVSTRLTGGSVASSSQGMSSGDSVFERAAMWVQGLFNKSKLDDTSKVKGFDAKTNGIALGIEKFVTDDVKAGIGYSYSKTDIDGFMRDTDVDTHTAIAYGEYKPNNWYVNGIATYGWSDYAEKKKVAGIGVKADYDVEILGLQAMVGYDMNVNSFGLTPEVGMRYVHISQDAYKDSADQKVSANDSDILTGVIGAKASKAWELENGVNVKPEVRVAATYDLMNDDVNSVVTLANGSAYTVNGKALDRFGMELGAGVTAEVNDKVELSLGYEAKIRKDYKDHTGLVNAKYKF